MLAEQELIYIQANHWTIRSNRMEQLKQRNQPQKELVTGPAEFRNPQALFHRRCTGTFVLGERDTEKEVLGTRLKVKHECPNM